MSKQKKTEEQSPTLAAAIGRVRDLSRIQQEIVALMRKGCESRKGDNDALAAYAGEVGILFTMSIIGGQNEQKEAFDTATKMEIGSVLISTAKSHRMFMEAFGEVANG